MSAPRTPYACPCMCGAPLAQAMAVLGPACAALRRGPQGPKHARPPTLPPNPPRPPTKIQGVIRAGLDIEKAPRAIGREAVPLPTLGPVLEAVREEVRAGRGFAVIRGFPVDR